MVILYLIQIIVCMIIFAKTIIIIITNFVS